ncbi:uncharacterized protein L201_004055 [Kwoniella dendrophila CBS 6074]|uniref:Polysaccharide lyase 14 domain-containing protein n=1 Tax=Kwoniella dendrophila CBS 6074 TaxID=1295534 RepID=A0AAX4JUU1_9TREE
MSASNLSSPSRWITTLPLLLAPLVATAPLPADSSPATLPTLIIPYTVIAEAATAGYNSELLTGITAIPTATATATVGSFDTASADSNWNTYPTAFPTQLDETSSDSSMVPVIIQPGDTSNDAYALGPTSTSGWALPPAFSDMSPFQVKTYAAGKHNMAILQGSPAPYNSSNTTADGEQPTTTTGEPWDTTKNALQILYPSGSVNPGNSPQGGSEFYAQPLDITKSTNASLEYSIYFPPDFDFVRGGKLPGLYGGHKGCSGGNAAEDCFSTRLMWRAGGQGELYLYAPKDKQDPSLCQTGPKSICDAAYGLSIGRGSWKFALGDWTTIRQDIWLNTPGENDGGFNIWVNGKLILNSNKVRYRENLNTCLKPESSQEDNTASSSGDISSAMINTIGFGQPGQNTSLINNEDWQVSEQAFNTSSSVLPDQSTSTSTIQSIVSTTTVTSTMPKISAYATSYTQPSVSASSNIITSIISSSSSGSSSAATSTITSSASATVSGPQKRDDMLTPSDIANQREMVITIPITDSIATVTTTTTPTATEFITVPITMMATATATDTITSEVQVTITPSASVNTVTNTVYITESDQVPVPTTTATASVASSGSDTQLNKGILINPQEDDNQASSADSLSQESSSSDQSSPIISQSYQSQDPQSQSQLNNNQPIIIQSPSNSQTQSQSSQSPSVSSDDISTSSKNKSSGNGNGDGCGVGFIGLFFSTFFGGHDPDWASPKDQYTYFRDFKMWTNN